MEKIKKYLRWIVPSFSCVKLWVAFLCLPVCLEAREEPVLNLYCWVGYIPKELIAEFEHETGIRVIYDVYDSNNVLEAKLFTGSSRYDVVCPSAWPYVGPQIQSKVYMALDYSKLPHAKNLHPFLMKKLKDVDPQNAYVVPYIWGMTGIGVNVDAVKSCDPDAPLDSLALFFNEETARRLSRCGIAFLEEAVDVLPLALLYLGLDPNSENPDDLNKAAELLFKVRPHIQRFGTYQTANDLANNELCVVQGWSLEIFNAIEDAKDAGSHANIQFIIPKEGTSMWVDVFAIPKGAPHIENAHKFIDFMMRTNVAARASSLIHSATAVKTAWKNVAPEVRNNPAVYPSEEMQKKLFMDKLASPEFTRLRSRVWFDIRSGRKITPSIPSSP